jgi:hypothetical protein
LQCSSALSFAYESDLRNLDAHCLIIENEAEDLGIPGDTITLYDPGKVQSDGWMDIRA